MDDISILTKNYVKINYVNYKNEDCNKIYEFSDDKIVVQDKEEQKREVYLGEVRFENAQAYNAFSIAHDI